MTRVRKDISIQTIKGQGVEIIPYDIIVSEDLDYIYNLYKNAEPGLLVESYFSRSDKKPVSFHPWQCSHNLLNLCSHAERNNSVEKDLPLLNSLVGQVESHMTEVDSAIYFGYPYRHELYGRTLEPPWFSSIAQGYLLAAWIKLYKITNNPKYLDMARATHDSFFQFRNEVGQKEPWISFIDDEYCLWFEEYPTNLDPQVRVLNGHIFGIMGLYSYYCLEPDAQNLKLMQAGMTTVQRYFSEYRRPGQVNQYCLLPGSEPDYMPERSVTQQKWLFDITKDEVFKDQFLAFQADMLY
jgi:hypothetical protein